MKLLLPSLRKGRNVIFVKMHEECQYPGKPIHNSGTKTAVIEQKWKREIREREINPPGPDRKGGH